MQHNWKIANLYNYTPKKYENFGYECLVAYVIIYFSFIRFYYAYGNEMNTCLNISSFLLRKALRNPLNDNYTLWGVKKTP